MRDEYQPRERPAAGGPPHNGFYVEGTVVRDAHNGERFSAITVREGEKSYWDIVCWDESNTPIAGFRQLRGGDEVRIEGHLAKRKNKKTNEWEISLVADKMGAVGRPPGERPQQARQPQYQPPQQQGWSVHQAASWQDPHQQALQAARGGQHPDQADWGPPPANNPPPWGQR